MKAGQYVRIKTAEPGEFAQGRIEKVIEAGSCIGRVVVCHGHGGIHFHHFDPSDLELLPESEQARLTKVREDHEAWLETKWKPMLERHARENERARKGAGT